MENQQQPVDIDELAERLLKTPLGDLADRMIDEHQAEQARRKGTFTAPVVYVQPSLEELKCRFSRVHGYYYEGARFDPIERCKDIYEELRGLPAGRHVAFECVYFDGRPSNMDGRPKTDEALAEMDKRGLRPALYEELLGFALKYPDEQRKHIIAALGSETYVGDYRRVAFLQNDKFGRNLNLARIIDYWINDCRFLAVRK